MTTTGTTTTGTAMVSDVSDFDRSRKFVDTRFGRIAYVERGSGPAALFIHGWPLNAYQWRGVMDRLGDVRRCIAFDTMGLGHTEIAADQELSLPEQAAMAEAFLDALGIDRVDIVGNDSGTGISQLLAVRIPDRTRSLTLTNGEVHDNGSSPALEPIVAAARAGTLRHLFRSWLDNLQQARNSFAIAFEYPDRLTEDTMRAYLAPILATEARASNAERFLTSLAERHMVAIEGRLQRLEAPTLVVWGTMDVFFPLKWAYWLNTTLPHVRDVVELPGAKLFFPEEHADLLSDRIRTHWTATG